MKKVELDAHEDLERRLRLRQKRCKHKRVPLVKSHYSDNKKVRRGACPDCGMILLELD